MKDIDNIEMDTALVEKRRADALSAMQIGQDVDFLARSREIEELRRQAISTNTVICTAAQLPRMQEYFFMPWFPMAEPNMGMNGRKREDLPDDADVHYYQDAYWTLAELHERGALTPIPPA